MTVRLYSSTDASAPTLTGQAGSLTTVLDAILVNGYGSQTAAGWTIAYTTTNKRAYQQASGGNSGTGLFWYIDDTAPGAGGAKEARAIGFETMSAITPTGTFAFPTYAQSSVFSGLNGFVALRKSTTADATARPWVCVADAHTCYFFPETGDFTNPLLTIPFAFGDFFSYHASDTYGVFIAGRNGENSNAGANQAWCGVLMSDWWGASSAGVSAWTDRSFTGVGGSCPFVNSFDMSPMNETVGAYGSNNLGCGIGWNLTPANFSYPNPADNACHVSPIWLIQENGWRGYHKGLWAPQHFLPFNHRDQITVSGGNLNGKSFIALNILLYGFNAASQSGQMLVEYSDTWV
jgi:hypothetical protein